MFDSFFCDTLNGMDCFDYHDSGDGHYDSSRVSRYEPTLCVTRRVKIVHETDRAYYLLQVQKEKPTPPLWLKEDKIPSGWYPKSKVTLSNKRRGTASVTIPVWLTDAKLATNESKLQGFEAV